MKTSTIGIRSVTKTWTVRLQIAIFTKLEGSHIVIRQTDDDNNKYLVDFGLGLGIDWIPFSVVDEYCGLSWISVDEVDVDEELDIRRIPTPKTMGDDVFDCFLDHVVNDTDKKWSSARWHLSSGQMLTRQDLQNLKLMLKGFFSAKNKR